MLSNSHAFGAQGQSHRVLGLVLKNNNALLGNIGEIDGCSEDTFQKERKSPGEPETRKQRGRGHATAS